MAQAPRPRRTAFLAALIALAVLATATSLALGAWQVRRMAWKEALIERVDRRIHADPQAAPGPLQWRALVREDHEYRRLRLTGAFDPSRQLLVHTGSSLGTGYWVVTPLRTDAGWVLVNRGFIPPELRSQVPPPPAGAATVVGLLRWTEPGGNPVQRNDPAGDRWYSRDVAAMAAARGLDGPVAPFFVDAQPASPADAAAWPRAGLTVVSFPNNHLSYALTWFALAGLIAGMTGYAAWARRRGRD